MDLLSISFFVCFEVDELDAFIEHFQFRWLIAEWMQCLFESAGILLKSWMVLDVYVNYRINKTLHSHSKCIFSVKHFYQFRWFMSFLQCSEDEFTTFNYICIYEPKTNLSLLLSAWHVFSLEKVQQLLEPHTHFFIIEISHSICVLFFF